MGGNAEALAEAYGAALDAAADMNFDFDFEGDALKDSDSVESRSEAIALLRKDRPGLSVSFTLPVMPDGLDDDGVTLLDSANNASVRVSTVNIMTMGYEDGAFGRRSRGELSVGGGPGARRTPSPRTLPTRRRPPSPLGPCR